jgi:hypothetical protein
VPLAVGADGSVTLVLPGGGGPLSLYLQAVCSDPGQPGAFAISNAVRVDFLP